MKNITYFQLILSFFNLRTFLLLFSLTLPFSSFANSALNSNTAKVTNLLSMININQADAKTLATLKGIGKIKAEAIVKYREENGSFTSLGDLTKIKGIGSKVLADNESKLIF